MVDRPPRRRSSLAEEHPAYTTPTASPEPAPQAPVRPTAAATPPGAPMPPPRRRRTVRTQLNTRVRQDLHERLMRFVDEHDAAVQDVIEGALEEYLDRRAQEAS